jgi:hypothetical protein
LQVLEKISDVAHHLKLPANTRIHSVIHEAFLKKHQGEPPQGMAALPNVVCGRALPSSEKVLRARPTPDCWELLVQWVGRSMVEASWEEMPTSKENYPTSKL